MNEDKIKAITKRQDECDHLGEYQGVAQQQFQDNAKGVMILITTIMCKKCGNLFFDTQDTNIKARVTVIPAVPKMEGGENEQSSNGKN